MTDQSNELLWLKYKLGRWRVVISLKQNFRHCLPWQHHNKQIDEVMDWINGQRWPGNSLEGQAQISKGKKHYNLAHFQFLELFNGSHHLNITTQVSLTNKNIFLTKSCCCSCPVWTISSKIWMGTQGRGQCQKHSQTKLRLFHWKGWQIHRFLVKV